MNLKLLEGLSEDQIQKVMECGDFNDLLQLAKDEEVQLSEEQLAAVTGGNCDDNANGQEEDWGRGSFNK